MMSPEIVSKYTSYLKVERNLSPKTISGYLNNLDLVEQKVGDLLSVDHRSKIVEAIDSLRKEREWGQEASTAWRCSHDICYFYKWAMIDGVIPNNPYPFNAFRKPQYHAVEFTTVEDWKKLIGCTIHLTHQDKLMLWVLWDTGLRRQELCLLDQEDFLLKERIIFLPEEKSKGGYGQRYVAMSNKTAALAIQQFSMLKKQNIGPHVFCGENFKRINPDEITARITRAGKVFSPGQFIPINPRKLRHSVPIRMLERGASDLEVMTNHGHASLNMTRRYTHSTKKFASGIRDKYLKEA